MTSIQVPDAFSTVIGMGAPGGVYQGRKLSRWGSLISVGLFLGGALIVLVYGLVNTYQKWQNHGPAIINKTLMGPIIISVTLFLIGLFAALSALNAWKVGLVIYQNGIAYRVRKRIRAWQWDEIDSITIAVTKNYFSGIYTGTSHFYTLNHKDGEKIILNDTIENIEELGAHINKNVFPVIYKRKAEIYNRGQLCDFGPVRISKSDGIQIKRKKYPWDMVENISIRKGILSIKKKDGGWFSGISVPASTIPNLEVLLSMVDQIIGVEG
jgi:hypothetical protein